MSYLKGRQNIFSIISGAVLNSIKKKTLNDQLKSDNLLKGQLKTDNVFLGVPNNFISNTMLHITCGNEKNKDCFECMKLNGITEDMLEGDNYIQNIEGINKVRNTQCSGLCSCEFSNISLSSHLIFSTGVNINGNNINHDEISESVRKSITEFSQTKDSSETHNYLWAILGGVSGGMASGGPGGAILGASVAAGAEFLNPSNYNDIQKKVNATVSNISMLYAATINQLISSSQEMVIKGTGVKVHNISIKSIQDIVMKASQENCAGRCVMSDVNDITNHYMNVLQEMQVELSKQVTGMFTYAYNENKDLIYGAVIFIVGIILAYFYLLFKKASQRDK
jgi:hypothetical protein